jgi:hypothetical protein
MAYADRHLYSTVATTLNGVTNAANTIVVFSPLQRVTVHRVGLRQSAGATVSASIEVDKLVGTVATQIATIVLPNSNTNGAMYVKTLATPLSLDPGDSIQFVAPTGFSATATTAKEEFVIEYSINEGVFTAGANAFETA